MGMDAEDKRKVEVLVELVFKAAEPLVVVVVEEDTTAKEYTRTKTSWAGERKAILREDDEETLSSKHLHGAF